MLRMILLAVVLLYVGFVNASGPSSEPRADVQGKILDMSNAEALTGAEIYIKELNLRAYASFDGSFNFESIPSGVYTIEIHAPGYKKMVCESQEVKPGHGYKKFYLAEV